MAELSKTIEDQAKVLEQTQTGNFSFLQIRLILANKGN
jgi:hypothetical protein